MTFSIAGRCTRTGRFGVAISSSSPAVAARCAHVRAGVGAVCSQNITDPRLGRRLLDLLATGERADQAVAFVASTEPLIGYRQLSAIGRIGPGGAFSGDRTLGEYRTIVSQDAVAAGNLLGSLSVPEAMSHAFENHSSGAVGDRLIAALQAGLQAGGEEGPVHSAGLLIVDQQPWAATDLRIDWSDNPIDDLARLWQLWQPQEAAYIARALAPDQAPNYGVPGDPNR